MTDAPDWTDSVAITGTPSVAISGTPTVTISGTVNAQITAGTVNVQNVVNGTIQVGDVLAYLGTVQVNSTGVLVTATFTVPAYVRALVVVCPLGTGGAQDQWYVQVQSHTSGVAVQTFEASGGDYVVAYVNPSIDTQWDVKCLSRASTPVTFQVFGDSSLPVHVVSESRVMTRRSRALQGTGQGLLTGTTTTLFSFPAPGAGVQVLQLLGWQLSALCRGTTLGANEGRALFYLSDGSVVHFLGGMHASSGMGPAIVGSWPAVPILPDELGLGATLQLRVDCLQQVGTIAMDVSATVEYAWAY